MRHYTRAERIFIHCCYRSHAGNRRRKHSRRYWDWDDYYFSRARRTIQDRIARAEILDALWYNDDEELMNDEEM